MGSASDDNLVGTNRRDTLYGEKSNERIFGNAGRDSLFGGSGRDLIKGGVVRDEINGMGGDDRLLDGRETFVQIGADGKPYYQAVEVRIENSLMIGNTQNESTAPLGLARVRDVNFNNNTVVGNLPSGERT